MEFHNMFSSMLLTNFDLVPVTPATDRIAILTVATNFMVVALTEVKFLDSNNIELTDFSKSAFADAIWYNDTTYSADKALDNNTGTWWSGGDSKEISSQRLPTKWWAVFSTQQYVPKISIQNRYINANGNSDPSCSLAPMIFQVMRWTGSAWQPIKTFFESNWTESEVRIFDISTIQNQSQFNKRVWAIKIHNAADNGSYKSMAKVSFWDNAVDIATSKKVFGSNQLNSYPPSNAVDNDINTFWVGRESNDCRFVIDFGAVQNPTSISITARNDSYANQTPGGFDVEYFDFVMSQWVSVATVTGLSWTTGETKNFPI